MVDLTPEEEELLKKLQRADEEGIPIDLFSAKMLYGDRYIYNERDNYDEMWGEPEFMKLYSTFASLADKGLLRATDCGDGVLRFETLTPFGRQYYRMQEKEKSEKRKERWGQRAFSVAVGIASYLCSTYLGRLF